MLRVTEFKHTSTSASCPFHILCYITRLECGMNTEICKSCISKRITSSAHKIYTPQDTCVTPWSEVGIPHVYSLNSLYISGVNSGINMESSKPAAVWPMTQSQCMHTLTMEFPTFIWHLTTVIMQNVWSLHGKVHPVAGISLQGPHGALSGAFFSHKNLFSFLNAFMWQNLKWPRCMYSIYLATYVHLHLSCSGIPVSVVHTGSENPVIPVYIHIFYQYIRRMKGNFQNKEFMD